MTVADTIFDLNVTTTEPIAKRPDNRARRAGPVSIVIPVRNGASYIAEAINTALSQGPEVGEVIVVDDGSSDATVSIVRSQRDSRIHLIANQYPGVSAARNLGARTATGQFLLFLDADDRLRPGAVRRLMSTAVIAPNAVVVYGDYDLIDGAGRPIGRRGLLRGRSKPSGDVLARLTAGNFIVNGGIMLIDAEAFRVAGGFDESLRLCEDWHCWCRLAATGTFEFVSDLLLDYRVHAANTMNAAARTPQDFFPAVERVFSDELILNKLAPEKLILLRKAAEIHLITYSATQAIRYRRYRDAFNYIKMVGARSPSALLRATAKIVLARLGI